MRVIINGIDGAMGSVLSRIIGKIDDMEVIAGVTPTGADGAYLTMDPQKIEAIMASVKEEIDKLENLGKNPIIITSPIVRIYFKKLTEEYFKDLIVVSYNELESNISIQSIGTVKA